MHGRSFILAKDYLSTTRSNWFAHHLKICNVIILTLNLVYVWLCIAMKFLENLPKSWIICCELLCIKNSN